MPQTQRSLSKAVTFIVEKSVSDALPPKVKALINKLGVKSQLYFLYSPSQ